MQDPLPAAVAKEVWRLAMQIATAAVTNGVAPLEARGAAMAPDMAMDMFRRRLDALGRGLTARELDVCARTLVGLTAEGIALDLDIQKSSVLTYRKRAYARLGISS